MSDKVLGISLALKRESVSDVNTFADNYGHIFMYIDHLYYCLEEIGAAHRFTEIRNNDFYKRAVARLIAVRTEDFVRIGLRENNATLNDPKIRADLVALEKLYEEFLQLQRDKFGAHFQKLDFVSTLQAWSAINLEKVDFFSTMALQCYTLFQSAPGYLPYNAPTISLEEEGTILKINDDLDIETYPNMSSDLLSLTRPNSAGLIHSGAMKHKMGVLKSIELIISYELSILKAIKKASDFHAMLTKLFIVDLVSYSDNFYTRTDIHPGTPQYELGLDQLLNITETPKAYKIVAEFRRNVSHRPSHLVCSKYAE